MKNRRMRLMAIFAAGVLSVTSMGGIVTVHAGEALAVPADEAGVVQTDGKDAQAAEDGSVAASAFSIMRFLRARTAGSSVSPSTPQFQL